MRDRSTTSRNHNSPPRACGRARRGDVCPRVHSTPRCRSAITRGDCRAPFDTVKPLRFAPTLRAGGLDGVSRAPRDGTYVMAGTH